MNDVTVAVLALLAFLHALAALAIAGDGQENGLPHPMAKVTNMLLVECALLAVVGLAISMAIHLHVGWL